MGRAIPDRQSDYLLNRRPELTWYTMGRSSNNNGLRIIIRIRSITGSKHQLHQNSTSDSTILSANQIRIPTVKLKIPGKLFLESNPELLLQSN